MMPPMNAPAEGLPPGCTCVMMAPGTAYEALALNPDCQVHNPDPRRHRARATKFRDASRGRNGF